MNLPLNLPYKRLGNEIIQYYHQLSPRKVLNFHVSLSTFLPNVFVPGICVLRAVRASRLTSRSRLRLRVFEWENERRTKFESSRTCLAAWPWKIMWDKQTTNEFALDINNITEIPTSPNEVLLPIIELSIRWTVDKMFRIYSAEDFPDQRISYNFCK